MSKGNEQRANTFEKQEVLRYMTNELNLNVMNSAEALNLISQIE